MIVLKSGSTESHPFLDSFFLPSWRAVRSYRPHLEERDLIWGDDWSYNPFIRRSPCWGFLGFSSALRQMPGDLCTAPRIISVSLIISDRRDWRKWPLARNPDRSWWHCHTSPWLHGLQVIWKQDKLDEILFSWELVMHVHFHAFMHCWSLFFLAYGAFPSVPSTRYVFLSCYDKFN